ncbi:MAG: flavodoxin family protein [Candidatus Dojkabacteria bacterium]|nr:MAG: flavodoxin family protein [Candidatus Dojkabacteria bacterium]
MIKIIYASSTGNTEIVCEKVSELLDDADLDSGLFKAEEVHNDIFLQGRDFILATSTWNNGQLNDMYLELYEGLLQVDLTGKRFGFIGLGDMSYGEELFCKGIDLLKKRALQSGGTAIGETFKIDGEFTQEVSAKLEIWVKGLVNNLKSE